MKFCIVFAVSVALSAASSIPLTPGDNGHYVEGESRYIWMPNGEGVPHLVDLHAPVKEEALRSGTGNNEYWLFTRRNRFHRQILNHGDSFSVRNSNYNPNHVTNVVVHGWTGNGNSEINPTITDAFLINQDCNVIVVDWSWLAREDYVTASAGVPDAGRYLGNFLEWLINTSGSNWNNFHLVGMSLGAHVVGVAGRHVGGRLSRVTGLDPAGPGWRLNANRLQSDSGRYVEAIHTDGGRLGIMDRSGDADFYPNRGTHPQPGCITSICSHAHAFVLFASSIRLDVFVGCQCDFNQLPNANQCNGPTLNMGNADISKSGNGVFCLITGRTR